MTGTDTAEKATGNPGKNTGATMDFAQARLAMIKSQLRTSGVNEEFVLSRMRDVAREEFLPQAKRPLAYIDRSVALDEGALAPPLFYGKALLEAVPSAEDNVLVIEGGTGYLSALVEPMVNRLDTISAASAAAGEAEGSYSLILIDGAIEQFPETLANCLEENGRVVCGLLLRRVTRLASGRKVSGFFALQPIEDLGIPVLEAFNAPKKWSFS